MDWVKGYSATYYVKTVDPVSWRDLERFEIIDGTIGRENENLRDSASFSVLNWDGKERWIRVFLDARQESDAVHVPLFTGIATSPEREINGVVQTHTIDCYSVLKPLADILLDRGWYIPAGLPAEDIIKRLFLYTPAPVIIEGSAPALADTIIAEEGETALSMVDKILSAIGWRMRISGSGVIDIVPPPVEAAAIFDPLQRDAVEPSIEVKRDWFNLPNVYRAIAGDVVGIARDDDPDSPLSIPARGREIWAEETAAELSDGETVATYAVRKLAEAQSIATEAKYFRRFVPDIVPGDVVDLRYPEQGLNGIYTVDSQEIELGYSARTEEVVKR